MYELLGLCLAFAALLTVNAVASLGMTLVWHATRRRASWWPAQTRAQLLFALRTFPAVLAGVGVLALLVPAYLAYEPWLSGEVVSLKLAALALVSALGVALACWRGCASWLATRRLTASWMRHAVPLPVEGVTVPAYAIAHPFPVIAVVGIFTPRLFVAECVLECLDRDEIAAAISHEVGHLVARDNLKRAVLRACRNVLAIVPCGRSPLDRAWTEAAEAAADEYAASNGPSVALDLASALVSIARMVPAGATPALPAGAFLVGEDGDGVAARVRSLPRIADEGEVLRGPGARLAHHLVPASFSVFLVAVGLIATRPASLAVFHRVLEQFVSALQ